MANHIVTLVQSRTFGGVYRKAVALILADRAGDDGSTYVGQERIAHEAEVSRRTVLRVAREFEEEGLIYRKRRHRSDGTRTSDRTFLVLDAIAKLPKWELCDPESRSPDDLSDSESPSGGDKVTGGPRLSDSVSQQEPSVEPPDKTFMASPAKIKTNGHTRPASYCPPDVRAKAVKDLGIRE